MNNILYSALIEQTIDQIELVKLLIRNKYKIQNELIDKWLIKICRQTIIRNFESSSLLNSLTENDFNLEIITDAVNSKFRFMKQNFQVDCGFSSVILFEQEDFLKDFRTNLTQIDKFYIDITIVYHLFLNLKSGFDFNQQSCKLFLNDFVVFKKESQINQINLLKDESFTSLINNKNELILIRNKNDLIKKKRKEYANNKLKSIIQVNYLKKWKNLHCIQVEKLIDQEINKLNAEKILQKQTIDDEKIVNFSMVTSIKKHIVDLKEMEINLTKMYNDSIENIQNKINNMKINVIKQKNLINQLLNEIECKQVFLMNMNESK
jgi:hypothetical protein